MVARRSIGDKFSALSRPLKIALQLGVLAVILMAVGAFGFIEYSAHPSFCTNCHLMEPYYESWASSSHSNVRCIECHYAPGIRAEAMGKLQAANQVVKYVTGTYSVKPWAEIEDAACLRSGCHNTRTLEGQVEYQGTIFDHTQHLGQLRRGIQLRCTSCHSQIVQGDHLAVTQVTCNLCHFRDLPTGRPVAECTACHQSPPLVTSPAGFVVNHPQYVEDLVSCVSCHSTVVRGEGLAEQSRCFNCHNETERLQRFDDEVALHRIHIADRSIECAQCHTPIEHSVVELASTFQLQCGSCHTDVHEAQVSLYSGRGGHATAEQPSSMYLASVSCESCHQLPRELPGHSDVQVAGEASCMSCHGTTYANILPSWQNALNQRTDRVAAVLTGATRAAGSTPVRARGGVDSLLGLALANVDLVQVGRGAHNIAYADDLLRSAVDLVRSAVDLGLPYTVPELNLGPSVSQNACLQCHLGIEIGTVSVAGSRFDHDRHVMFGGNRCTSCHTSLEEHGGTLITDRSGCNDCHHNAVEPRNCAACHEGPGGAPEETVATETGLFPHQPHRAADLACRQCHTPPAMDASGLSCDNCHENHHQPDVSCSNCHSDAVRENHVGALFRGEHPACAMCHGDTGAAINRWTPQLCLTCHSDKSSGHFPGDCTACHQMPPMGEVSAAPHPRVESEHGLTSTRVPPASGDG